MVGPNVVIKDLEVLHKGLGISQTLLVPRTPGDVPRLVGMIKDLMSRERMASRPILRDVELVLAGQ